MIKKLIHYLFWRMHYKEHFETLDKFEKVLKTLIEKEEKDKLYERFKEAVKEHYEQKQT